MNGFSKKQLQILAFPNTKYDALICDGAIRAGKTSVMSIAYILWGMRQFSGVNFGICSKTIGTAERNIILPLLSTQWIRERFNIKYSRGRCLTVSDKGKTNTFYLFGGKDESSYQLVQGITLAGVLLDEVALMPRSFVEQAMARCSVTGSRFWFNCNPEGPMHWFYKEWIERPEAHNAQRLHFTMNDNPSLSKEIRERYESMYTGVFYRRYILGEWCIADGIVYDMFDTDRHVLKEDPQTYGDYYVSSDFGIQNATVFLLWRKEIGSERWICLNEYYYSGRENSFQKTVSQLREGLEGMLPVDTDGNVIEPETIIVDPSASALIVELRKNGHSCREANNDVLGGIADVSTMLQRGNLALMERCKNTIAEFGLYAWDSKAADRGEDKPIKENDHAMDAVRYFVKTMGLVRRMDEEQYYSIFG